MKLTRPLPPFAGLTRLLAAPRAADHPVALTDAGTLTWSEFTARIDAVAAALRGQAAKRWLLALPGTVDFCVALLGALHAGRTPVLPPNFQPATLAAMAGRADATIDAAHPALRAAKGRSRSTARLPALSPQATFVLYTSGSAGEAKALTKTLEQLESETAVLEQLWGPRMGTRPVIATVPHFHIYGLLFRLAWPLAAGRPFEDTPCTDAAMLAARFAALGPAALVASPALLARLPDLADLSALRADPVFSSGGPLPRAAALALAQAWGQAPIEVYGSTETGGIAWRSQTRDDDSWTPLPGVRVDISPEGTVCVSSRFAGPATVRTADAAELLADGRFRLRGRLDRIVKIAEKRLSLPELEAWLAAHPWVGEAAAAPLPEPSRLGAAVTLTAEGRQALASRGARHTTRVLRNHLAARFELPLLPRRWRFVEALPRSDRGKLPLASVVRLFRRTRSSP